MHLCPSPLPSNPSALKILCGTLDAQSTLRLKLIDQISDFEIQAPNLKTWNAYIEKMEFYSYMSHMIISKLSRHQGVIISTTELVDELKDVADLFTSIHHLVTTKASAFPMDGGTVKNTTLFSLIPEIWKALKSGPLASTSSSIECKRNLTAFIVAMGALNTDKETKTLTAEYADAATTCAFLTYLNSGADGEGLYHSNDIGFIKTRKKQRCYYQFHPNIRLGLTYILCAMYHGDDMESLLCMPVTSHKGGEDGIHVFEPLMDINLFREERSELVGVRMDVTRTIIEDEKMITERTSLLRTVEDRIEHEVDTVSHKTVPLDLMFIQALATLGRP